MDNPIAQYLTANNISQAELGIKVGVSQTTIYHWSVGMKKPHDKHIHKLARILGRNPGELLIELRLPKRGAP